MDEMNKSEIYEAVKQLLIEKFEIKGDLISPEKLLNDDLELDSLDAVDLLLYIEDRLDRRPDPALFRNAMSVQDLVDILHPLWRGSE
jgi:acyl carrier protein